MRLVVTPSSPPKKRAQDQRARSDEFAKAERDHGESGAGAARRDRAEQDAESEAAEPPDERHEGSGTGSRRCDDGIHRVDREKSAEPVIDGVTEREQAGLAEQHVVGEREHDHDAHQAHHGERLPERR